MPVQISAHELSARLDRGEKLKLLDVRTAIEHQEINLPAAQLMPLDQLDPARVSQTSGLDGETIVVCKSGTRAQKAAVKLVESGMTNVKVLEGGMQAWTDAGFEVARGRRVVSLERQVRIAAGVLVLTSIMLGTWVHPACFGLGAFVGAGLIFAGITDWCGMGLLLARAPWNQSVAAPAPVLKSPLSSTR